MEVIILFQDTLVLGMNNLLPVLGPFIAVKVHIFTFKWPNKEVNANVEKNVLNVCLYLCVWLSVALLRHSILAVIDL